MKTNYSYLWILDFEDTNVYKYQIDESIFLNTSDYEDFITGAGHSLSQVQWMVTDSHLPIKGN